MFKEVQVECTENEKGWLKVTDFGDGTPPAIEVYADDNKTGNVCCPNKEDLKKIIDALSSAIDKMV
ncbi:hypothetical protein [Photobacterium damselae]|uniref:hypothetical protein n=1 Tax=Photobacterium damselae TaxID=38293 RepID=UPI00406943EF